MKTNKLLSIARAKLKYYRTLGYLGAYLTHEEVKALLKEGYVLLGKDSEFYKKKLTRSKPNWVYFEKKLGACV